MSNHLCVNCGKEFDCGHIKSDMDLGISCLEPYESQHKKCDCFGCTHTGDIRKLTLSEFDSLCPSHSYKYQQWEKRYNLEKRHLE